MQSQKFQDYQKRIQSAQQNPQQQRSEVANQLRQDMQNKRVL